MTMIEVLWAALQAGVTNFVRAPPTTGVGEDRVRRLDSRVVMLRMSMIEVLWSVLLARVTNFVRAPPTMGVGEGRVR